MSAGKKEEIKPLSLLLIRSTTSVNNSLRDLREPVTNTDRHTRHRSANVTKNADESAVNPYIRNPFKHSISSRQATANRKQYEFERNREQRISSATVQQQQRPLSGGTNRVREGSGRLGGRSPASRSSSATKRQQQEQSSRVLYPYTLPQVKPASERPVSPSREIKVHTTAAVDYVKRNLPTDAGPTANKQLYGHLRKGRLLPLNTAFVTGPSIHRCLGIQTDKSRYLPSPSRTFQRRRQLIEGLATEQTVLGMQRPVHSATFTHQTSFEDEEEEEVLTGDRTDANNLSPAAHDNAHKHSAQSRFVTIET